jgi:hypothetical protein
MDEKSCLRQALFFSVMHSFFLITCSGFYYFFIIPSLALHHEIENKMQHIFVENQAIDFFCVCYTTGKV